MTTIDANTPKYVLIEGSLRIGPMLVPLDAGRECSAIYGFSDKRAYDRFIATSDESLKPYPLVKDYLRSEVDAQADRLTLVVIDASGPGEPCLHAGTIEAVLEAHERRAAHLTAAYRLTFDDEARAYRVDGQWDVKEDALDATHA